MDFTHDALIARAASWLTGSTNCSVVITDMVTGHETPDAIGFSSSGMVALIECKASRADFFADARKPHRIHPERGMGGHRWYMTPVGLVSLDELPDRWGLLEVTPNTVKQVVKAQYWRDRNHRGEVNLLVSAMRRIGNRKVKGVSVKVYTYYDNKKSKSTLGILVDEDE